jgi:hypothetical protein
VNRFKDTASLRRVCLQEAKDGCRVDDERSIA